jgi:hypothetical protein
VGEVAWENYRPPPSEGHARKLHMAARIMLAPIKKYERASDLA